MKAMRKILPALCMLLVSAVMLGSSTFAWFSANRTVSANGMQITASAPQDLKIGLSNVVAEMGVSKTFTSKAEWYNTTARPNGVMPTEFVEGTTAGEEKFTKIKDEYLKKVNPDTGAYTGTEGKDVYMEESKSDVFACDFYLYLTGAEATNKQINWKITIGDTTALTDVWKALSVLVCKDGKKVKEVHLGDAAANGIGASAEFDTIVANKAPTGYTLYFYLDGNNANCNNKVASKVAQMEISIEFTI